MQDFAGDFYGNSEGESGSNPFPLLDTPQWRSYIFDRDCIFDILPLDEPQCLEDEITNSYLGETVLSVLYPNRQRVFSAKVSSEVQAYWVESHAPEIAVLSKRLQPRLSPLESVLQDGFKMYMQYSDKPNNPPMVYGNEGNSAGVRIPFLSWENDCAVVYCLVGWSGLMPDSRYYGGVGITRQLQQRPITPCNPESVRYVRATSCAEAIRFVKQRIGSNLERFLQLGGDAKIWGVNIQSAEDTDESIEYLQDKISFILPSLF